MNEISGLVRLGWRGRGGRVERFPHPRGIPPAVHRQFRVATVQGHVLGCTILSQGPRCHSSPCNNTAVPRQGSPQCSPSSSWNPHSALSHISSQNQSVMQQNNSLLLSQGDAIAERWKNKCEQSDYDSRGDHGQIMKKRLLQITRETMDNQLENVSAQQWMKDTQHGVGNFLKEKRKSLHRHVPQQCTACLHLHLHVVDAC